jgi:hypothetical protein
LTASSTPSFKPFIIFAKKTKEKVEKNAGNNGVTEFGEKVGGAGQPPEPIAALALLVTALTVSSTPSFKPSIIFAKFALQTTSVCPVKVCRQLPAKSLLQWMVVSNFGI